jgi:PPOX class probable F420-dependent enzyme
MAGLLSTVSDVDEAATLAELPAWARALLDDARVARLAHADEEGHPRVLPVTFAVCGAALVTAIDDWKPKAGGEPARVRRLRARPAAAVLVDAYDEDWGRLAWVQVLGDVAVRPAAEAGAALDALAAKYPPYAARRPPGPVLELTPRRALAWTAQGGGAQRPSRS